MSIFDIVYGAEEIENAENEMSEKLKIQMNNLDALNEEFSETEKNYDLMVLEYWENFSKLKKGKGIEFQKTYDYMKDKYKSNFRLRHDPENYYVCAFEEFAYCINVYLDLIDDGKRKFVIDVLTKYKINQLADQLSFISAAKRVSTIYKKFGPMLNENWKYVVDIQTLSGVVTQGKYEFKEDIMKWIAKKDDVPKVNDDHEMYVSMMCKYMYKLMNETDGEVSTKYDLTQLITQPERWVTGGTTTDLKEGERNVITYDAKMKKEGVKKTKALISVAGDVSLLIENIFKEQPFRLYAAQKEELGKARTIVTGGDRSYFIMKYLFQVAFDFFESGKVTWCPVYMNKKQIRDMHIEVCALLARDYFVPPADADQFDKYQSKSLICKLSNVVLEYMLQKLMSKNDPNAALYGDLIDLYKVGMNSATVNVLGETLNWEGGMMSGWYVTIFFDSIISYCYMSIGYAIMEKVLGEEKERKYSQGDDLMPTFKNKERMLLWLYVLIKMLKIKFNISKFWTGNGRSEFLRMLYYPECITAYPVRPISKLVFQKDKDTGEANVVSEIAAKYDTLLSRGCDETKVNIMMQKEIKKFVPNYQQSYAYSCIAFGGYGWTLNELKGEQLILKEVITTNEKKVIDIKSGSPANVEIKVARTLNMEDEIEKKLKSQVKYNSTPPSNIQLKTDTIQFNLIDSQVNYSSANGSLRDFRHAFRIDNEEVKKYGPNIASVLADRRAGGTEIVQRIVKRCTKEGLSYIKHIVNSGASFFGGGIPECYVDQHEYVCNRLINYASKSIRTIYINDLKDCVAKNIYVTSNSLYNTRVRDMQNLIVSK